MNNAKRFVNVGDEIHQYGEWWCSAKGSHCAEVITEALNLLIEENNELKQKLIELDEVKWLRDNTVWEQMPSSRRTYSRTYINHHKKE